MRSTGEVMGIDADLGVAYAKSQIAAGGPLPMSGTVFISVSDVHKKEVVSVAKLYAELGFNLVSTAGLPPSGNRRPQSAAHLQTRRRPPNALDLLKNREIQLVINTPAGQNPRADEVRIRTTAVYTGTPIMTTLSGARAAALGIAALKNPATRSRLSRNTVRSGPRIGASPEDLRPLNPSLNS